LIIADRIISYLQLVMLQCRISGIEIRNTDIFEAYPLSMFSGRYRELIVGIDRPTAIFK